MLIRSCAPTPTHYCQERDAIERKREGRREVCKMMRNALRTARIEMHTERREHILYLCVYVCIYIYIYTYVKKNIYICINLRIYKGEGRPRV